ncbi:hypothetical protein STENM36S_06333 [Streptomyces tendae]
MTDQTTEDDERAARNAWLLSLSVNQITRFGTETMLDWLDARREWRVARLRAACRDLREQSEARERSHARLAALLSTAPHTPLGGTR